MSVRLQCVLLIAIASVSLAFGQGTAPCKVHDPELQGSYSGGCRNGWADGDGEAAGTAHYEGGFRAGRKQGRGVKQWPSGDRYEGEFVGDHRDGSGTYTWGRHTAWAGERYTGNYRNGRRHGFGVYEWPDGDRYAGDWNNDVIAGPPAEKAHARSRAHVEHASVVAIAGNRVCRRVTSGIATQTWVRGTVTAVKGDHIAVRNDGALDPLLSMPAGVQGLSSGVVWDAVGSWTACE